MQEYRDLCARIWNEIYVPRFPEYNDLILAEEGYVEICRNLVAAAIFRECEYDRSHLLFPRSWDWTKESPIKLRLRAGAEIQAHTEVSACSPELLNFVDFFDWERWKIRPFELVECKEAGQDGNQVWVRYDDVEAFLLDESLLPPPE